MDIMVYMVSMLGFGSIMKLILYDDIREREVNCMWVVLTIWGNRGFSISLLFFFSFFFWVQK